MNVGRTERHVITKKHPMYSTCDELCFQSKNMFNYANYIMRQEFINNGKIINYNDLTFQLKHSEPFKELGSNSSQHVLKMLCRDWKAFLVSVKDYFKNPNKYFAKPRIPKYKPNNGRHVCILTNMQSQIKDGYLYFAFKRMKSFNNLIKTKIQGHHMCTRVVPKGGCYVLEIVYEKEIQPLDLDKTRVAGIDLGLNNFITIVNNIGEKPIVVNGKGIKSYNQYWNKQMAKYKSITKKTNKLDWTNRLQRMTDKRNNKMDYFMHCTSKFVVDSCLESNIGTIIIGKNKEWKQESKMNKVNNQKFVQIPYESFINKLKYKCEDYGIELIETEESHTSGTSFLDNELPVKENYDKSRRRHRGLFISNKGIKINADVNAAYQIIKKVFPNAFADGIEGVDLHPLIINL